MIQNHKKPFFLLEVALTQALLCLLDQKYFNIITFKFMHWFTIKSDVIKASLLLFGLLSILFQWSLHQKRNIWRSFLHESTLRFDPTDIFFNSYDPSACILLMTKITNENSLFLGILCLTYISPSISFFCPICTLIELDCTSFDGVDLNSIVSILL